MLRTFLCHWGAGYVECADEVQVFDSFTNDIGYDDVAIEAVDALQEGETADLSDMSGIHTVKRISTIEAVARAFAQHLEVELGSAKFAEVKREGQHNYDRFCDTNMSMEAAIEQCGVPVWEADHMPDAVIDLWNAAWDYARAERLI